MSTDVQSASEPRPSPGGATTVSDPARAPDDQPLATPDAKQYQRRKLTIAIVDLLVGLSYLVLMALWASRPLAEAVARLAENRWAVLVLYLAAFSVPLELLLLPLSFYSGYVLEHRHGLSNQTLAAWLIRQAKGYWVSVVIALPLVFGLYALLWFAGPWWWLLAAGGWFAVMVLLGRLAPVLILPLFYRTVRLEDPDLLAGLRRLADGTDLQVEGIYRLDLSRDTKKANAALTGLGRTRRVLLGDTLLNQFTPEEIEVVFAHELGHHIFRHIPKGLALSALTTTAGLWLCDRVLSALAPALGYPDFRNVAAFPLLVLVLSLFSLALVPAHNALSRRFERACDRYALHRTHNRDAYISAFGKLALLNKADPNPHPLVVFFFYDHPPLAQRIALASDLSGAQKKSPSPR